MGTLSQNCRNQYSQFCERVKKIKTKTENDLISYLAVYSKIKLIIHGKLRQPVRTSDQQ